MARLLPKLNTELADNKYSWGSLTLSVLDSIPTNAIDFHTGSTILGYLAFFFWCDPNKAYGSSLLLH